MTASIGAAPELALVVRMSTMAEVRCMRPLAREAKPCNKLIQVVFAGTRGDFSFYCARCHVRTRTYLIFEPDVWRSSPDAGGDPWRS